MRDKKVIMVALLIVAVLGLSIGFAAFSSTLRVSSSAAVNPDSSNFKVQFSKVSNADQTGSSYPITPSSATYGEDAIINSTNKTLLENVHAKFTYPGQSVTYNLYVRNTGDYNAYLTDLTMGTKTCTRVTTKTVNNETVNLTEAELATQSLVTQACQGISISVQIGSVTLSKSGFLGNQLLTTTGSTSYLPVTITITYGANASIIDGPILVSFGNITFTAQSQQGTSPSNPWVDDYNLTSSNVVFDETYSAGEGGEFLDYFTLDSEGGFYSDEANFAANQMEGVIGSGVYMGTNYMLFDTAELGYPVSYCQMIVFDGVGTASYYAVEKNGSCTYSGTLASGILDTYTVSGS